MNFSYRPFWDADGGLTLRSDEISLDHFYKDDFILSKVRRRRVFYENDLLFYLAYAATRGGIYVDVGANIGNHSIYFAKYLADFVLSIEPSARLRAQLDENLSANGLANTLVVGVGVGKERASGRLVVPEGHAHNFGMGTVAVGPGDTGEPIEIHPLQSILDENRARLPDQRITLIKIDVEGMGPEVLEGCTDVLAAHHPQVVIEAETQREYEAVRAILDPLGYKQVDRFCATPTYFFVNPSYDTPPARGVRYRLVDLLRVADEKLKRMTRRLHR